MRLDLGTRRVSACNLYLIGTGRPPLDDSRLESRCIPYYLVPAVPWKQPEAHSVKIKSWQVSFYR